ncbi:unnamed protein product [Oppiella nova]|uniref:Uncharacterized protein n=1 Tax=Oppiella nova TaxID=334625 RepID=A0A7R9LJ40_9ACAR|nr:unnamed protein product [Oppiella nova]CAG2164118.1 unnamed protein product [Oppiella nova]
MNCANKWLLDREVWDVVCCETIGANIEIQLSEGGLIERKRVLTTYAMGDTDMEGFNLEALVYSRAPVVFHVKLLRLWVRPFDTREYDEKVRPIVPQIQFRDFEPKILDSSNNTFESIDEVVARLNGAINAEEITGKVLNVQTLACSAGHNWEIDSQSTRYQPWVGKTVFVLRVFWRLGPIQDEEVGLADFAPQCLVGGGMFKRPQFESQSCVLQKASKWLSENLEINFFSAMSVYIKLKSMVSIDTKQMSVTRETGNYVRFLRIAYTKPRDMSADILIDSTLPAPPPIYLKHQVFVLHKDYSEIKNAINDFIGKDEWRTSQEPYKWLLLNCETFPIFAKNYLKTTLEKNTDRSFQALLSSNLNPSLTEYYAIKLYYDVGHFGLEQDQGQNAKTPNNQNNCSVI